MPANTAEPLICPRFDSAELGFCYDTKCGRCCRRTPGEKQSRGVRDLDEATVAHLEDADLVGSAKPVLDRTQDAKLMPPFALEIKDCVNHVLEHARARNDALFGHMAHQHQDKPAPLRRADQLVGGCADLAHSARRTVQGVEIHRLDRVDDDQIRRVLAIERCEDVPHIACGGKQHGSAGHSETFRTQPNLVDGLLAGDVGCSRGPSFRLPRARLDRWRNCRRRLEQQSRLANSRITADQDRRAGHKPPTADAVEFGNTSLSAGRQQARPGQPDKPERTAAATIEFVLACPAGKFLARKFFDQAVPAATAVATAGPLRVYGRALLTDKVGL